MYIISKEYHFSASHQLHDLPEDHPCHRLHGHNYVVEVDRFKAIEMALGKAEKDDIVLIAGKGHENYHRH